MNKEIKKIARNVYIAAFLVLLALLALGWVFTQSFVTLQINPKNSTVMIDNKIVRLPLEGVFKKSYSPGMHTVSVESEGYIGFNKQIEFKRGFTKPIEIILKEMPTPIKLETSAALLSKGNDFNDGYYLGNEGKTLFKLKVGLDENSQVRIINNQPITSARLENIKEIIWSPDKQLALLRKLDGKVTIFDFKKYDFVNQTESPWGENIGSVAWAPDGSKIAYFYSPPAGEKTLVFADNTNTAVDRVYNLKDLGIENPLLKWSPDSQWLLIIPKNTDASQNKIYIYNTYNRQIKTLTEAGDILDAIFSPDSNQILYSSYSKQELNPIESVLSVMNIDGSNQKSLGLHAEIKKTTWSKDSKEIILSTYDSETKKDSIFKYNTESKENIGFYLKNFTDSYITRLYLADDNKFIVYESDNTLYVIKVN